MGTGSGILALAAAKLLRRKVLATDIEPWSVRVAAENAALNGVARRVRARLADGWKDPAVRGFTQGLCAHGFGTARAFQLDHRLGAFAGLAMALNGLLTALLVPLLLRWL